MQKYFLHITLNNQLFNYSELHQIPTDTPWQQAIVSFLQDWFDDNDSITVQTSGSTGTPKTYELKKQCMVNSARMTNEFFNLDSSKTALLCMPATYIAGKMMLVRALVGGFNLLCVEPSAKPFEQVKQVIDFVAVTPYQMQCTLDAGSSVKTVRAPSLPITIHNIIIGGAPVSQALENQCKDIPANIYETYGMTETFSHIALRKLNTEKAFTILKGISILQDDRDCLIISAPELTEEELQTNDIVELVDDTHFRWLGRIDNVINSGGVKIHPELVERKLEGLISLRYFMGSLPDEKLGEKVVLVIESATPLPNLEDSLKQILDKFEMPKQILYVPEFVCSVSGKMLRTETLNLVKN
jgi:O-succinylbenzoic acid--CoA ligase